MRNLFACVLLVLACLPVGAQAQQQFTPYPAEQLLLLGAAPGQPVSLTVSYSGALGSDRLFYWVLATHARGQSGITGAPSLSNVGTLSAANTVQLSWPAVAGATSYSVLRTTAASGPVGTCACLVTTTTTPTASDTGAALTNFTVSSIPSFTSPIRIDNSSEAQPFFSTTLPGASFRFPLVGPFTAGSDAAFDSRGNLVDSSATPAAACTGFREYPTAACRNGSGCFPGAPFVSDGITETQFFGGDIRLITSRFNNAQTDSLALHWQIPSCFDAASTVITLDIFWMNDSNTGSAEFDIETLCVSRTDLLNAAFSATNVLTTEVSAAPANQSLGGQITLDLTGCAAGDTQLIRMARQAADPYAGEVYMYSWLLSWE